MGGVLIKAGGRKLFRKKISRGTIYSGPKMSYMAAGSWYFDKKHLFRKAFDPNRVLAWKMNTAGAWKNVSKKKRHSNSNECRILLRILTYSFFPKCFRELWLLLRISYLYMHLEINYRWWCFKMSNWDL